MRREDKWSPPPPVDGKEDYRRVHERAHDKRQREQQRVTSKERPVRVVKRGTRRGVSPA